MKDVSLQKRFLHLGLALLLANFQYEAFSQLIGPKSFTKGFRRAPELNLAQYEKIIIGDFTADASHFKEVFQAEIPRMMEALLADRNIELITQKSVDYPYLNYREIALSHDSSYSLPTGHHNTLLITGFIKSCDVRTRKIEIPLSKERSKKNCYWEYSYEIGGTTEIVLRYIDMDSQRMLSSENISIEMKYRTPSKDCTPPPAPDEEKEVRAMLRGNSQKLLKKIIIYREPRSLSLLDGFFGHFPLLRDVANQLQIEENKPAMEQLRKYTRMNFGRKTKSQAYHNLAVGFLCTEQADSALHCLQKAMVLRPGKKKYQILEGIIQIEKTNLEMIREQEKGMENEKENSGLTLNRNLEPIPTKSIARPNTFAVIAGVADYKDTSIRDLAYSERDCRSLYDFLKSPNGGSVPEGHLRLLTGPKTTRANFIRAMNETFMQARPDDFILLFLACHGETDAMGSEVYFLLSDTDHSNLEGTAVSDNEIQKIINKASAEKKLIIADACHSGGIGLNDGKRASGTAQMVNRLQFQMGQSKKMMAVLSASSNYETSQETKELGGGHGVFTHYLLEGLYGAADADGNGLISIREIQDFTYQKVSAFTNGKQHPELKGYFSGNFPISVLNSGASEK